jgi:drug/metabolite transporter superfamily protein YnfA
MTYFLFLLAIFGIIAPFYESGMPGNGFARFCGVVFAAFFWATWVSLFSLVGYIILG